MSHLRRYLVLLVLAAGALAGCAGTSNGVRPVIGVDGTVMNLQDPVENGRALVMTGQYGLAIEALQRALQDDPKNVRALNLLAEAYARLHRYDLADRYHGEALAIDPDSVAALNNLGFSLLVRGDRQRATELLQQAAAVAGDQPVVAANLRLAVGDEPADSEPEASVPTAGTAREIPLGKHIVILHRSGKLVRLAPGVQLLMTDASAPASVLQPVSIEPVPVKPVPPISADAPPLPYVTHRDTIQDSTTDPRALVFAALQDLLDPAPFGSVAEVDDFSRALPQNGPVAWKPSSFGIFAEVDDFNRLWPEGGAVAGQPGPTAILVGQVSG